MALVSSPNVPGAVPLVYANLFLVNQLDIQSGASLGPFEDGFREALLGSLMPFHTKPNPATHSTIQPEKVAP